MIPSRHVAQAQGSRRRCPVEPTPWAESSMSCGGLLGTGRPRSSWPAQGFSDSPHFMYSGYDKNGEWYQLYSIGFGGVPGKPSGDGPDGHSLWPSFTNVPNEFLESYFPLAHRNLRNDYRQWRCGL